jgi:hypothetical protein
LTALKKSIKGGMDYLIIFPPVCPLLTGFSLWTWEVEEVAKGTYTYSGTTATFTVTHEWEDGNWMLIDQAQSTGTVSGNTLITTFNNTPITFTKESGGGTSVPAVPAGVTAAAQSSSGIDVSWDSVSGARGYRVYRAASDSGNYFLITDLSTTSCSDTGLSAYTTYYYKVSAYNSAGESAQSGYVFATTTWAGTLSITVRFNLGAISITGSNGTNTIRKTGTPSNLELSAEGYDDVIWYVDGGTPGINDDALTINASDYPAQLHSVTFWGRYKNGAPYSQTIPFTVVD